MSTILPSSSRDAVDEWIALIDDDDDHEHIGGGILVGSTTTTTTTTTTTSSSSSIPSLANSSALDLARNQPYMTAAHAALSLPSTALGHLAGVTPQLLAGWSVADRHLLNHYLQSVARSLSSSCSSPHTTEDAASSNPFIALLVPLALSSPSPTSGGEGSSDSGTAAARHALIALSAAHLARLYPDFERDLLRHRSRTLRHLKRALAVDPASLPALAATLLMCLLEICAASSRRWLLYLGGARAVLSTVMGAGAGVGVGAFASWQSESESSPLLAFLVDLHDYICCMGGIVTLPRQLKQQQQQQQQQPSVTAMSPIAPRIGVMDTRATGGIHPLFGAATELYQCLARINKLALESHEMPNEATAAKARDIELALQSWCPPVMISNDGDHHPTAAAVPYLSVHLDEARAAAFAVQWAAMLRLRELRDQVELQSTPTGQCSSGDDDDNNGGDDDSSFTSFSPPSTTIQSSSRSDKKKRQNQHQQPDEPPAVSHILSSLSLIRPGSQVEAHLLFPLFMAGVFAQTKASRLTIDVRLNMMKTTIGFGHVARAHGVLDQVWRRRNRQHDGNRGWRELMSDGSDGGGGGGMVSGLILF